MIEMQQGANSDTPPAMTAATTDPPKNTLLCTPGVPRRLPRPAALLVRDGDPLRELLLALVQR
jgi:hypothetical protein